MATSFACETASTVTMRGQAALGDGPAASGAVISIGLDALVLDADGRIRTGHQFIEA